VVRDVELIIDEPFQKLRHAEPVEARIGVSASFDKLRMTKMVDLQDIGGRP
jgi:hypothetical protein